MPNLDGRAYDALLAALCRASPVPPAASLAYAPAPALVAAADTTEPRRPKQWQSAASRQAASFVDKAEELLCRTASHGLVPPPECWAKVIAADASTPESYARALRLYRLLLSESIRPDNDVVYAMLTVLNRHAGDEASAVEVSRAMLKKYVRFDMLSAALTSASIADDGERSGASESRVQPLRVANYNLYLSTIRRSPATTMAVKITYAMELYPFLDVTHPSESLGVTLSQIDDLLACATRELDGSSDAPPSTLSSGIGQLRQLRQVISRVLNDS